MKITLDIADQKADFFLELLTNFQDFVRVEKQEDLSLPEWHMKELAKQVALYREKPEVFEEWKALEAL